MAREDLPTQPDMLLRFPDGVYAQIQKAVFGWDVFVYRHDLGIHTSPFPRPTGSPPDGWHVEQAHHALSRWGARLKARRLVEEAKAKPESPTVELIG